MSNARYLSLFAAALLLTLPGCSGSSSNTSAADTLGLSLTSPFLTLTPDGTVGSVIASAARSASSTAPITMSVSGAPAGVTVAITQPGSGSFGTLLLTSSAAVTAGSYPLTVTATDGTATATATLTTTLLGADAITLTPAATTLIARQDATPASLSVTVARANGYANAITLTAAGLPTGLTASYAQPGTGTAGSITFTTGATPAAAGVYAVTLTATDGKATTTAALSITVAVVLNVTNATDTTIGLAGHLQQYMSTGFQPSSSNNNFFTNFPNTANIAALQPEHLRIQPTNGALPWLANSSPQQASDWSFTALDTTVQPVLGIGDQSPILQIGRLPAFLNNSNGNFNYTSANVALLTTYAQNLVRYYNTGGFTWGGKQFQSPGTHHITWWAILNEPNLNGITVAQYVTLYNTLVPAMLAVDPTLKFVALELSDYSGQPAAYLPTLVLPAASGGLNTQVNAIATHFYGTCLPTTTDAALFTGVTQFATDVSYFRTELATRSDLASVPVWVTENNVNSDYAMTNGYSNCTPTALYVLDPRGTSAFFTAYRPLIFSKLGKAGNEGLYHFLFEGSAAYGEVNSGSDAATLAYWSDYWLARTFPWDGVSTGALLYKTTTTEPTSTVDVIATLNANSTVSLMVTNYATASSTDANGNGGVRTVYVNLASLGTFSSATEVDLNAATPLVSGPSQNSFTPSTTLTLRFSGYGASLFTLRP